jgi:hypothetical protein
VIIQVPEQNDTSPYTARPWVSLDRNQLEPGNNQTFSITVNVPGGTVPGEYYASVLLQTQAGDSGITSSILIPITLTVNNSAFTPDLTGQISDISIPAVDKGEPVNFLITLSDTGNCRLRDANADITIRNMFQNVIWQSNISLSGPPMLPYYPRLIDAVYPAGLDAGDYTVTSDFTLPNGWIQRRLLLPSGTAPGGTSIEMVSVIFMIWFCWAIIGAKPVLPAGSLRILIRMVLSIFMT